MSASGNAGGEGPTRGPRHAAPSEAAARERTERAQATGQTQWWALVYPLNAESASPLACYAAAGLQDRFYWERPEKGTAVAAWGSADAFESSGARRFVDVENWAGSVRARLAWCGAARSPSAPLLLGGFGFGDDEASPSEWKSFPPARFFLPETLVERTSDGARRIEIIRVEPGMDSASLLAEVAQRSAAWSDRLAGIAPGPRWPVPGAEPLPFEEPGPWPAGPEYRVQSDRPHRVFRGQVTRALSAIEQGHLEKVVLARSLRVDHDGDVDIPVFLGRLREMYPTCTLVAVGRGDDTFLAATPETLVRVSGDVLETVALAGTAPRGRTPEEDAELAEGLVSNPKERAEHAHVVSAIRDALAPDCLEIEASESPRLRALFGIQHLETPIHGRLRAEAGGILSLIERLHPTPAVGGVPRTEAAAWLRQFEGMDRGWYASPIGWLDGNASMGGDFSVGLRSALIRCCGSGEERASRARLFAGAGIVDGSDPGQELAETRIKLRALLAPLTEI